MSLTHEPEGVPQVPVAEQARVGGVSHPASHTPVAVVSDHAVGHVTWFSASASVGHWYCVQGEATVDQVPDAEQLADGEP